MHLAVEFEGIVRVGHVLLGLLLFLRVGRDPVEKLCPVARVFGVSGLIIFESLVVALFFFKRGFPAPAERPRQIIAADKSRGIQHSPANHDSDARHGICCKSIFNCSRMAAAGVRMEKV